jgi:signal recognition particle subunit SRP19
MAEHNPDRIVLWPGYFNTKLSRKQGRRVAKTAAVSDPTLDTLALAARNVGLTKMKREADTPHPKRASLKEGRLWLSKKDLQATFGNTSKEAVMAEIATKWRSQQRELKEQEIAAKQAGPKTGDKRARSQRKQVRAKGPKRQKKKKWKL